MNTGEVVFVTVLSTLAVSGLIWGLVGWAKSAAKERRAETLKAAVWAVENGWQMRDLNSEVRSLRNRVYELETKPCPCVANAGTPLNSEE